MQRRIPASPASPAPQPFCPALKKCRDAGQKGWEVVSRYDIGQRLAIGHDRLGLAPYDTEQRPEVVNIGDRWDMCRSLGVGEGPVGTSERIVDLTKNPQREGVENLRCGARILTEPVGQIAVARRVVEFDGLLKMIMSGEVVAEINAGVAGNAVRDQGLGAIGPGRGFAQEKLGHFPHRRWFAAHIVRGPKTVIGGKPLREIFRPAREFADPRKGRTRFRRRESLGPDQRIAEAGLEVNALLAQRGGALHRIAL